eukprot:3672179-Amphidinium_carterae.1
MGFTYDKLLLCALLLHGHSPTVEEQRALTGAYEELRRPLPLPGSFLDRRVKWKKNKNWETSVFEENSFTLRVFFAKVAGSWGGGRGVGSSPTVER